MNSQQFNKWALEIANQEYMTKSEQAHFLVAVCGVDYDETTDYLKKGE